MILNTDEETLKNTFENAPITVDFLLQLGFVCVRQNYEPSRYMYHHQKYCQSFTQVVFYHHKEYDDVELNEYPENMLLVKVSVTDNTTFNKDRKKLYLSTAGQLIKYVEYLKKRDQVDLLEYEIHDLLEESFFSPKENV